MKPMISVVLPTYNGETYIREAVGSILTQTFQDFELIIVDDCSTDRTPAILEELAESDRRIRVIRNQENRKLPKSLNIGFAEASGQFFTWTSDDNKYGREALETMLGVLLDEPETDIVYAYYDLIDSDGKIISDETHWKTLESRDINRWNAEADGELWNWAGACFLYRRNVHEKLHGYDETLFLAEDFDFWVRALRYFQYKQLKQRLYQYRVHGRSLTATRELEILEKVAMIIRREIDGGFLKENYGCCRQLAWIYYRLGKDKEYQEIYGIFHRICKTEHRKMGFVYRMANTFGIRKTKKIRLFLESCRGRTGTREK